MQGADAKIPTPTAPADRLTVLTRMIRDLSRARGLDDVTSVVRATTRELTGADGVTFVLRDGDLCHYAEENAIGPLWKGQKFPLATCISGWVMLNKRHAAIEDIYQDPRIPIDAYRPTFVKSLLMMPVRSDAPLAAIGNYWARRHVPTADDIRLVQALADAVSVALENVALVTQLEARVEELSRANRAKDEFLMSVSHELRTPLNAMLGWSQLLLAGQLDPAEAMLGAATIERSALHQVRVIDDLLDTTRIRAGQLTLQRHTLDLAALVDAAVRRATLVAVGRGVTVTLESPTAPIGTNGDERRIAQVLDNLLSNAVKYSRAGGRVTVSLERAGPSASLTVRDEGIGMAPSYVARVFERFAPPDGSSTRRFGGLGLGLAIARDIVTAHGGTIEAHSAGEGRGASFHVRLPLSTAPLPEPSPRPAAGFEHRLLRGANILALDVERDTSKLVEVALGQYGASVLTIGRVSEAMASLKAFRPDVVVCALHMDDDDPEQFLRGLRSDGTWPLARVPAIALVGADVVADATRARLAGFDACVAKPVRPAMLVTAAATLLLAGG